MSMTSVDPQDLKETWVCASSTTNKTSELVKSPSFTRCVCMFRGMSVRVTSRRPEGPFLKVESLSRCQISFPQSGFPTSTHTKLLPPTFSSLFILLLQISSAPQSLMSSKLSSTPSLPLS